jgi:putative ABC transport system permease protein
MILGNKVYTSIFPDSNALGKVVTLKGRKFTIVGVFKKKGTVMMDFVDNVVCIPENTFF